MSFDDLPVFNAAFTSPCTADILLVILQTEFEDFFFNWVK